MLLSLGNSVGLVNLSPLAPALILLEVGEPEIGRPEMPFHPHPDPLPSREREFNAPL